MNAVLGTLLFAGVTIPMIDPIIEERPYSGYSLEETAPDGAASRLAPISPSIIPPTPRTQDPAGGEWPPDERRRPTREMRRRTQPGQQPESYHRVPLVDQMPLAPTDPLGMGYPLPSGLPTGGTNLPGADAAGQRPVLDPALGGGFSGGDSRGYMPSASGSSYARGASAERRRAASRERRLNTFSSGQFIPNRGPSDGASTPFSPASSPEKPFADYRPSQTVSPYMRLFSNSTGVARAENYHTLVRPYLDQRSTNARIGTELKGLERSSRRRGSTMQGLQIGGQPLPQFYQNYGDYYPGFYRR